MEWAPVIALLSFFAFRVLLESGKANRLRAAWAMDKKGTTVPNRLSRLQHQFKIGTQPAAGAARCRRSPLQAPGVWNPHNRHLSG